MSPSIDSVLAEAMKKERAGDLAGARGVLDAAPEAVRTGAWHYARGTVALRGGQVPEAVTRFEEAVRREPEIAEYRSNLGAALLELAKAGDRAAGARALTELEKAAQWGASLPDVHANLSFARLMAGDAAGALAAADAAVAMDAGHAPSLYNRAAALHALGRLEDALAALDATLKAAPGLPPAVASRASLLKKLGRA